MLALTVCASNSAAAMEAVLRMSSNMLVYPGRELALGGVGMVSARMTTLECKRGARLVCRACQRRECGPGS